MEGKCAGKLVADGEWERPGVMRMWVKAEVEADTEECILLIILLLLMQILLVLH